MNVGCALPFTQPLPTGDFCVYTVAQACDLADMRLQAGLRDPVCIWVRPDASPHLIEVQDTAGERVIIIHDASIQSRSSRTRRC